MPLDFSDYNPENPNAGGLVEPGKAHLLVVSIEDKGNYVSVEHTVIAHEDPTQVGKTHWNSFKTSGKGANRLQTFLEITNVLTRQDIIDRAAAGETDIEPEYELGEGKTYMGLLEYSEYTKDDGKVKKSCKVEFEFYNVNDPATADYPRDTDYAKPIDAVEQEKETIPPSAADDEAPF